MDDMKQLHSILALPKGSRKPTRRLETPSKTHADLAIVSMKVGSYNRQPDLSPPGKAFAQPGPPIHETPVNA